MGPSHTLSPAATALRERPQAAARLPGLRALPLAGRSPDEMLAMRGTVTLDRGRFAAEVAAWRAAFAGRGWRRVGLYFDDAFAFAAALFGAWHAGLDACLPGDAQPATLARIAGEVDAMVGDVPSPAFAPPVAPTAPPAASSFAELDPRRAHLSVHTSGSSGEPVVIPKRLDQIEAEVAALQAAFGTALDGDTAPLAAATVSHQHIYGLLFLVMWPLYAGRPFLARRLEAPEQLAMLPADRPRILVSSPAHLRRLSPGADWASARAGLRAVFSSGGPLPPEGAADALALLGHSPVEVYGSSETGGIAWRQRASDGERWTPLPGVQWRLDEGLLCVRSDRLPDDAWFRTSDRAQAWDDGRFELLGRADRIVKVMEKRVSLSAIERALVARPEIAEARALLLPAELGARLAAVAVLTAAGRAALAVAGRRALNDTFREHLLDTVERVALPRRWRYVTALPADLQGKSTEAALAALFRPTMPEPEWLARGAAEAAAELDAHAGLRVFDGHFPAGAILPGVAQLDWAARLARVCFAMPARMRRAEALKFQRPVTPGTRLTLTLTWKADTGTLGFRYRSAQGEHSSGRLVFGDGDA